MKTFKQRTNLIAIASLLTLFAACKGESPTAPSNPSGSGGTTPPTTPTIVLSVSNANPLVNSNSVITATVAQGGSAVPNGTAVQFTTNLGTFTDANSQTTIKTTTGGVATTTLTSAAAGTATVTATVGAVSKTTTVAFSTTPVIPQPPDTTPSITSVTPTTGRPQGGETVTITGKNFRTPIRVFFDFGAGTGQPVEATVISSSATSIQVLTPAVDLGTGQTKVATIIVLTEAGTPNEVRLTAGGTFTYQATILTPKITTVSPASGPIDGGTRVTIFGEGFQAPVQVFFGSAETQVLNVSFSQITVISPAARDTAPNASGTVTGPVDIKVNNISSATSATLAGVFRYIAKAQITAFGPTEGSFLGGTKVTIDGTGFNDPVVVVIGGVAAQPISVSPTQIVAITGTLFVTSCSDSPGPVSVSNVDNGDTATAATTFIYRVPTPVVISATSATAGGSITITVLNANGIPRLTLGDTGLSITNQSTNASTGVTTFTATVPSTITLATQACAAGGAGPIPTAFDVTYTSLTTHCTNTLAKGTTISPASTPTLFLNPAAFTTFTATFTPATATPTPATITPSAAQTVMIVDTGAGPLTVTSVTNNCSQFSVNGPAPGTVLGECDNAPITVKYNGPAITNPNLPGGATVTGATTPNPTSEQCTITLTTSAGTKTLTVIGNTQ